MGCFGKFKELKSLKQQDIYITNNVYGQLTKGHVRYLEELHMRHTLSTIEQGYTGYYICICEITI